MQNSKIKLLRWFSAEVRGTPLSDTDTDLKERQLKKRKGRDTQASDEHLVP